MFSVQELLSAIAEELDAWGTTSRHLRALQFEARSGNLRVFVGREPHPAGYPSFDNILRMICATCEEDGINVPQLELITFFDTEINLECSRMDGDAVYTYQVEAATVH